jgi:glucose-1-phosphate adenylyltransferase
MRDVLTIILGGGRGKRLYPLTKLRAKPAVPLAGKYRLIDIPISNSIHSEIKKIYILTQYNSTSLNRHVGLTYNFSPLQEGFVEILTAQQTPEGSDWFRGSADAVRRHLTTFKNSKAEDFLILSGDHLYRMDYRPFIEHHRKTGADITLSVLSVEEAKASDFGLIKIDEKGTVVEFREKPTGSALDSMRVDTSRLGLSPDQAKYSPFIASMGIYVFKRQILVDLLTTYQDHHDFGKELIPAALGNYRIQAYLFKSYWEDIGTIRSFFNANIQLVKSPDPSFSFFDAEAPIFTRQRFLPPSKMIQVTATDSLISDGCIIRNASINRSVIGIRSIISNDTRIENSLVMGADFYQLRKDRQNDEASGTPPVGIGNNTLIRHAIIDKNARIGNNVQIINKDAVQDEAREEEGIWIKDGIVIVTKNAVVPNDTVI